MHKIIQAHLKNFVEEHSLEKLDESKQFEKFANYCVISRYYPMRFDLDNVTTDDEDAGIDGLAFLVDGELVTTQEEAKDIFKRPKKNIQVDIVFVQAKSSEKFERGEILKFGDGVDDYLKDRPSLPHGEFLKSSKEVFDVIINNVAKVSNGRPNCYLYYVTTGTYENQREIEATFKNIQTKIMNHGVFNEVFVTPVDKDELVRLWTLTWATITAKFDVKGYTPFPEISGITEAYLAIVPAVHFVESVLCDSEGKLRNYVFQENVRSFLGDENPVNDKMKQTLINESSKDRFAILNNGITIISPDVRIQSDTISIENFQIVNGCQTSNVLYHNKDLLDEKTMITLKVVEAEDPNIISEVIRGTNSQTNIDDIQFLSLRPIVRRIEEYFNAINSENDEDIKLFFERRDRQYNGQGIPESRIFDIKETSRAVTSMFLERPDLAARYPTQMFDELDPQLFHEKNREIIYYTAALALYRIHLLIGNKKIPYNYRKYKWHMLMCLKYVINEDSQPSLSSKKIETYCEKIISACREINDNNLNYFNVLVNLIHEVGEASRDVLKRKSYIDKLKKTLFVASN